MESNEECNTTNCYKINLRKEEVERYCRQIILPEIGPEGQEKISKAKVLVVGAGGLGSPLLMYLAGAGIGTIGVVDGDSVDLSNLHRQVIHSSENKGINKAISAEKLIKSFNPYIEIITYEEHLTNKNGLKIAKDYDLIVDCCDNPATRYLTNDICVVLGKPLVSGSAVKWEGQLTVYVRDSLDSHSNKLPCYRCLFPMPTPPSAVCNCGDSGVFGPVPGVIGTMQANECIKLILGANEKILAKRMLTYDAYEMSFKIFKLRNAKDECIVCGLKENVKITEENLKDFDYEEFTNPKENRIPRRLLIPDENNKNWSHFINEFKAGEINKVEHENKSLSKYLLIDVRPQEQFKMFNLNSQNKFKFLNIPLKEFKNSFNDLVKDEDVQNKKVYIMCRAGNLSTHAVDFMLQKGYSNVYNLSDGIHGYIKEIDSENTPYY
jgi:adenylyltransferase/sulfurtransferase